MRTCRGGVFHRGWQVDFDAEGSRGSIQGHAGAGDGGRRGSRLPPPPPPPAPLPLKNLMEAGVPLSMAELLDSGTSQKTRMVSMCWQVKGRSPVGGAGLDKIAAADKAVRRDDALKGGGDFGVLQEGLEAIQLCAGDGGLGTGDGEIGLRGGDRLRRRRPWRRPRRPGLGRPGLGVELIELLVGDGLAGESFFLAL